MTMLSLINNAGGITIAVVVMVASLTSVLMFLAMQKPEALRLRRRIQRIRARVFGEQPSANSSIRPTVRRKYHRSILGILGEKVASMLPHSEVLQLRLEQADVRLSIVDYLLYSSMLGGGFSFLLHLIVTPPASITASLGIIMATGVPHLWLNKRIRRRQQQFLSQFPDALDLIVRGVRSGLPVTEAIHTVAQEFQGITRKVFEEIIGNIRLGMTLDEALASMSRRVNLQEFRFFIISLSIQQETGGNLAEILEGLSRLMRRREQVRIKIKAMSSEARASATIIGSLPFVMAFLIYYVNPGYISKLFVDPRGMFMLMCGLMSLVMGLGIMIKMVRFEI